MASEKQPPTDGAANGQPGLVEQATENILGPNPFIGLQVQDILASYQALGRQLAENPKLLLEQEATLIRDLISVLAGKSELAPTKGDKRFVGRKALSSE